MKILVCDKIAPEALEELKKLGEVVFKTGMEPEELKKEIADADVAVVRSATKLRREIIEAAKNLKLIVRAGIGLDNIDLDAAKEKGIEVRNTPAATSISVAELVFAHMLAAARMLPMAYTSMKAHKWEKKLFQGFELYGKTLGIIGFGRIGREVAKRAICFGMKVLWYDVVDVETDIEAKRVSFDELLSSSDFITLHVPLLPQTKYMINSETISKMKDGVVLVNAARGGVVEEKAVLEALESGKIAFYCVDVFEKEPTDNFALIDHPKVIPTPHIGASAKEGQFRAGMEVVRIVREFFS
ncbi:MAG: D-2-hydroxyacid dehydrogenase [Candidatus Aminicenantes bacterium]|nr:D-2-hydroxyacid dehydrogenase [Candidatus Aminicenantes bacterium]